MILLLLTAHFIGDFLCQSDWMAINKSKRWDALTVHVMTYTSVVMVILAIRAGITYGWHDNHASIVILMFCGITFAAHFITDAVTSRITSKLWFFQPYGESNMWRYKGGNRHWFFVVIGFDQLLHAYQLILTWQWLQ